MGVLTNLIEMSSEHIARKVNSQLTAWVLAVSAFVDQASQSPFQNVLNVAEMQSLDVSSWLDGTHCWVRTLDREFVLKTTSQLADPNLDTYTTNVVGRIWMGP